MASSPRAAAAKIFSPTSRRSRARGSRPSRKASAWSTPRLVARRACRRRRSARCKSTLFVSKSRGLWPRFFLPETRLIWRPGWRLLGLVQLVPLELLLGSLGLVAILLLLRLGAPGLRTVLGRLRLGRRTLLGLAEL